MRVTELRNGSNKSAVQDLPLSKSPHAKHCLEILFLVIIGLVGPCREDKAQLQDAYKEMNSKHRR